MKLVEAIIDANHRAIAGDSRAGVHPGDYPDELPLVALTCVDPRLNALLPNVLGLPSDQFIWLRNAGNVITSPLSSTTRSLALALAIKGGKEIAIIGHTNCQVCATTTMRLLDRFKELGIERHALPENINEYFSIFSSERQNVIKSCDLVRKSPIIGPKVAVHGLIVDIITGALEWIVNGYQTVGAPVSPWSEVTKSAGQTVDALKSAAESEIGKLKANQLKIGDAMAGAAESLVQNFEQAEKKEFPEISEGNIASSVIRKIGDAAAAPPPPPPPAPGPPPKLPLPPPMRPRFPTRRGR